MAEKWKDIPNFEGLYQVSDLGNVRSLNRIVRYKKGNGSRFWKGTLKTQCYDNYGYKVVSLSKDGRQKAYLVHRLVALSFLGKKGIVGKFVIDHIDHNKKNNSLSNLQFISHRKNCSKDKNGTASKYTGAYLCKKGGNWYSQIRHNGKKYCLGTFATDYEAGEAYKEKLKELVGGGRSEL